MKTSHFLAIVFLALALVNQSFARDPREICISGFAFDAISRSDFKETPAHSVAKVLFSSKTDLKRLASDHCIQEANYANCMWDFAMEITGHPNIQEKPFESVKSRITNRKLKIANLILRDCGY